MNSGLEIIEKRIIDDSMNQFRKGFTLSFDLKEKLLNKQETTQNRQKLKELFAAVEKILQDLVNNNVILSSTPFIEHPAFFRDNVGHITKCSITENWALLSNRSQWTTLPRAKITIDGANHSLQNNLPKCPYRDHFNAKEITNLLVHPCDTGVVQKDGSLNEERLFDILNDYCFWDYANDSFVISETEMSKCVTQNCTRDKNLDVSFTDMWNMMFVPSPSIVAIKEWDEAFMDFSDCQFNGSAAMSLRRFIMFYYAPTMLFKEVLGNKYPHAN